MNAESLLTIPKAARRLQVAERTLRLVLAELHLQSRLVERTRKVGIYHKFTPLLPSDLLADLISRFTENKPENKPPRNGNKADEG